MPEESLSSAAIPEATPAMKPTAPKERIQVIDMCAAGPSSGSWSSTCCWISAATLLQRAKETLDVGLQNTSRLAPRTEQLIHNYGGSSPSNFRAATAESAAPAA